MLSIWLTNYILNIYSNIPLFIKGNLFIFYGLVIWFFVILFFLLNIIKISILYLKKSLIKLLLYIGQVIYFY